jgi:hypothetical protein
MANIIKPLSVDKAIMWHKIAFTLKPDFEENFIEIFTYLTLFKLEGQKYYILSKYFLNHHIHSQP